MRLLSRVPSPFAQHIHFQNGNGSRKTFLLWAALWCTLIWGYLITGTAQAQTTSFAPGLDAAYYSNETLSGTPTFQTVVPYVDAYWSGSPAPGIPADHWSATFSGYVTAPSTGNYEFGTNTDDGCRLWVNGQLVIDDWNVHGTTYRGSAPIYLVQGQRVPIIYHYFDYDLGATSQVGWGTPGNVAPIPASAYSHIQTVPGLEASYYANDSLSGTPAATTIVTSSIDGFWGGRPAAGVPENHWSASFSGYVTAASTGNYEFGTVTDDGSRLWVNGQLVIDDWVPHGSTYRGSAPISLVQGQKVPIVYQTFDNEFDAQAQLRWGPPGNTALIPLSALSYSSNRDPQELWTRFFPRSNLPERMIGGIFQGSNDASSWSNLATITSQPSNGAYTELGLGSTSYRYLRYVTPASAYGNIAELEFYKGPARLTGTGFGSAGSYQNSPNYTFDKALDGDTSTYFDGDGAQSSYFVGIDTGRSLPILAIWSPGPPINIDSQGIRYPNQTVGRTISSGGTRRLNAYTATDWDVWTRTVAGVTTTGQATDVCSYTWSASTGSFPDGNTGTTVMWQAPSTPTLVTITLTVRDQAEANRGLSENGSRTILAEGAADSPRQFTVQVQVN